MRRCLSVILALTCCLFNACADTSTTKGSDATGDAFSGPDGQGSDGQGSDGSADSGGQEDAIVYTDKCVPKSGDPLLLRIHGTIWTGDTVIPDGEVFVNGKTQKIVCVGEDCSTAQDAATASVICTGGVVTPGLINPHDHGNYNHLPRWNHGTKKWKDRYQWQADADYKAFKLPQSTTFYKTRCEVLKWAELRTMIGGATSIQGQSGATCENGWVRDLDDTKGGSGLAGYTIDTQVTKIDGTTATAANAWSASLDASMDGLVLHLGEGIDDLSRNEWYTLVKLGLAKSKVTLIHGAGLGGVELADARAHDVRLIWSPQSNLDLYGDTTKIPAALNLGMTVALGPDWTPSGSMNLLDEMRCAKSLSDKRWGGLLTADQLLHMVTTEAARAMGADTFIGRLQPGMYGDVSVFSGDRSHPATAVLQARTEQVRLVVIGGRALYGDADLMAAISSPLCETLDVCGVTKTICVKDPNVDGGTQGLGDIEANLNNALKIAMASDKPGADLAYAYDLWPLFQCGAQADALIKCDTNGAAPSANDLDGDGLSNDKDNCPKVWNPDQGDLDSDKAGDACDACPLAANAATCSKPSASDSDGDGIANDKDNCPMQANPGQEDADGDGKGDVCDPCPQEANPGSSLCLSMAIEVTQVTGDAKTFPDGTQIVFKDLIVTAVLADKTGSPSRIWAQSAAGGPGSGVQIVPVAGNTAKLKIGQLLTIQGVVATPYGLKEIDSAALLPGAMGTPALPLPVAATVLAANATAIPYHSLLVEVVNAKFDSPNADAAAGKDFGEALLVGGLRVDDVLIVWDKTQPRPAAGDMFTALIGVMNFTYSQEKLEPRSAADFVK